MNSKSSPIKLQHFQYLNNKCQLPRSLLLQLVGLSGRLGQDPPLGNEDDMLTGELLLQLADQSGLDFLERLQLRDLENIGIKM